MPGRFRVYEKHRVVGTTEVVVICDMAYGAVLSMKASDKPEDRVTHQIHSCSFVGPDGEGLTEEQCVAALATPLPAGWQPSRQLFASPKDVGEEFSTAQVQAIVAHISRISRPSNELLATFRGPGGAAAGGEPGPNGAAVGNQTVGAAAGQ